MCLWRHGCFVPHLAMDFQKGRNYVRIKCATDPLPILHKADQYGLFHLKCFGIPHRAHDFHWHVHDSHFLSLSHITDLIPAGGKFHLAAQVPRCFARFSLNFVQGAGQLDGRWDLWWPHEGLQLEEACGHGCVIPSIVSLGLDQYLIHAILALMLSKKSKRSWKALQTPSLKKKIRLEETRETGLGTQRGCSHDLCEVQQAKCPESFTGSHDLDADPLTQCHHRLSSQTEANQNENESGLKYGNISWLVQALILRMPSKF